MQGMKEITMLRSSQAVRAPQIPVPTDPFSLQEQCQAALGIRTC